MSDQYNQYYGPQYGQQNLAPPPPPPSYAYSQHQLGTAADPFAYQQQKSNRRAEGAGGDGAGSAVPVNDGRLDAIRPACNDWFWVILFFAQLFAVFVFGFYYYSRFHNEFPSQLQTSTGSDLNGDYVLVAIILAFSICLGLLFLGLVKVYAYYFIWASLIFAVITSVFGLILAIANGSVIGVIFGAIFLVLTIWYVYAVRSRIPFACAMIHTAIQATQVFPTTYILAFMGLVVQLVFSYVWYLCATAIFYAATDGGNSSANSARFALYIALALSFYWTVFVIKYSIHVSVSGVAATWYFQTGVGVSTPAHPVLNSVKRALTTSFGSICLASLILAAIRVVRILIDQALAQARSRGGAVAVVFTCILECILNCIEAIAQYITTYALAHVAIYGKPFIPACRDTFELLQARGWTAVINDSLISGALMIATLIGGVLVGAVGALFAVFVYNGDWPIWFGFGFITGMAALMIVTAVVESCVVTLFVCLAEQPAILAQTKPDDYTRLSPPLGQAFGIYLPGGV